MAKVEASAKPVKGKKRLNNLIKKLLNMEAESQSNNFASPIIKAALD